MSKAALKFLLERGSELSTLVDLQRAGIEVKSLEHRPDAMLAPELQMMLGHFLSLSRHRTSSGMTAIPNAIPLTEIEAYWRIHDIGDYMGIQEFASWIIMLDNEFVEHYTRKEKNKAKS